MKHPDDIKPFSTSAGIYEGEGGSRKPASDSLTLNDEERAAMDDLLSVMNTITQTWGMTMNGAELGAAVHVIQGFVIQHMLHRLAPDQWSGWTTRASTSGDPAENARGAVPETA